MENDAGDDKTHVLTYDVEGDAVATVVVEKVCVVKDTLISQWSVNGQHGTDSKAMHRYLELNKRITTIRNTHVVVVLVVVV